MNSNCNILNENIKSEMEIKKESDLENEYVFVEDLNNIYLKSEQNEADEVLSRTREGDADESIGWNKSGMFRVDNEGYGVGVTLTMTHLSQKFKSSVYEYFSLTPDGKHYVCQCLKETDGQEKICTTKISAFSGEGVNAPTRAGNLKRHLLRQHPRDYKTVNEIDDERKKRLNYKTEKPSTSWCQTGVRKFKRKKISVNMTVDKFKACIINMAVKNALPLTFFSSSAFISLNGEMAQILDISLKPENIRNMIMEEAQKQKQALKDLLHGRMMFLKIDFCTRHRANYFAINVYFINNKKEIVTSTLTIINTKAYHTSEYLEKLLSDVLNDFNIKKEQILSIVTDNAYNMVKTLEINNKKEGVLNSEDSDGDVYSEEIDQLLAVDEYDAHDIDSLVDIAAGRSKINHMPCSAHTLQLAMRNGLKGQCAGNIIGIIRKVAVTARKPSFNAILKRLAGVGALLDQECEWESTYKMIRRILKIKPFLSNLDSPSVNMTEAQWKQVEQLEGLLSHPYNVTKKLQTEDLTPGLFYRYWKTLIFRLSQNRIIPVDGIRDSLIQREKLMMENDVLLAAIYVDAMYRAALTEAQQRRAKATLCEVALQMKGQKYQEDKPEVVDVSLKSTIAGPSSAANIGSDDELDFEEFLERRDLAKRRKLELPLDQIFNKHPQREIEIFNSKIKFYKALEEVEKIDRSSKLEVKEAIKMYPEIVQNAAMLATALPLSQVSVKRLYSALKIIRSDLRASIDDTVMEAILFLRTNSL